MEIKGLNEYKHLILKYDHKLGHFVDATKEIFYLKWDGQAWYVGFVSNGQYYHMSKEDIMASINPLKITFNPQNVYINNKLRSDVQTIIKYDQLGYKIFFKDYNSYYVYNIQCIENNVYIDLIDYNIAHTGNRLLDYYKTLAKYAADNSDSNSIEHILFNLYYNVKRTSINSVLESYTLSHFKELTFDTKKLIYPFNTNQSQMSAIENAFKHNLSVISGPPGTGKTQVILNLICNGIINNKKIAVISNNNTAIDNVYQKMKDEHLSFLIAYLGNSENVSKFFNQSDSLDEELTQLTYQDSKSAVSDMAANAKKLYQAQNDIILEKNELEVLIDEYNHFKDTHILNNNMNIPQHRKAQYYLDLKFYLLSLKKINLINRLKLYFKYQLKIKKDDINQYINNLEYFYYEQKIIELNKDISSKEQLIKEKDMGDYSQRLKIASRQALNNYLIQYYKNKQYIFSGDDYKDNFGDFIDRYPVILSTTQSLLRNMGDNFNFDMIIMDEASQSDIMSSLLTMNVTKQMVIVGDEKQLPQIDNQEIYGASTILAKTFNIPINYQYKNNSILHSVLSLKGVTETILREHYRCDAKIIGFCNKKFYDNELIICTSTKDQPLSIIHTVAGNHARHNPNGNGYYNDREAQEILEILAQQTTDDIGIITPFRAQADYIQNLIKDKYPNVEVDTIHKYQGRQKKIIILSTVVNDLDIKEDNHLTDFVTNSALLNVAISRAIDKLYLVISDGIYHSSNNTLSQLIDYIQYNSNDIQEGKITSIFDILYQEQDKVMVKSPINKYVDSYAESVMLNTLHTILKDYPDYLIHLHYTLRDLINDYEGFSKEEIKYINHPKTHVDFVIFDKITLKPVLCIEVDGTKYHDYAPLQISHDHIKDNILEHNHIKMLRLKTNRSGEEILIREALNG